MFKPAPKNGAKENAKSMENDKYDLGNSYRVKHVRQGTPVVAKTWRATDFKTNKPESLDSSIEGLAVDQPKGKYNLWKWFVRIVIQVKEKLSRNGKSRRSK